MRESDLKRARAGDRTREQQDPAGVAGLQQPARPAQVRIESPIDGIVTRRNIEEGENGVVGTMNNPARCC
jgi:multidrug resistance efflux pump